MENVLEMKNISKKYSGTLVLDHVSLSLKAGEIKALIGENGAGKSTLIKILAGSVPETAGEIYLNGERVSFTTPDKAVKAGIGVVYQELNYFDNLSAAENIFVGDIPMKAGSRLVDKKKMYAEAKRILDEFGFKKSVKTPVGRLSMSEKQLLEIARITSKDAKVVVFDEPTTALNESEVEHLYEIIRKLKSRGIAVIYISHRLEEIFHIADTVKILRDGHDMGDYRVCDVTKESLIRKMVGREIGDMYPKATVKPGSTVLEIKHLSADGVRDVSLQVCAGEIVSVFGLMGSGRTPLMEAIFGVRKKTGGEILVDGTPVRIRTPFDAVQNGIAYVPAERKVNGLVLHHSIQQNNTAPSIPEFSHLGLMDNWAERRKADEMIVDYKVSAKSRKVTLDSLSGGNQQKVMIGKWLRKAPRILLINEPTRGIDVGAKVEIYKILETLCQNGAAILMVSSELPELLALSDRVYSIRDGQIMREFSKEEATQEALLESVV